MNITQTGAYMYMHMYMLKIVALFGLKQVPPLPSPWEQFDLPKIN